MCQQRMVADHIKRMHEVCADYVRTEKRKDLANMYQLLKPISGGKDVLATVGVCVTA